MGASTSSCLLEHGALYDSEGASWFVPHRGFEGISCGWSANLPGILIQRHPGELRKPKPRRLRTTLDGLFAYMHD